MAAIDEDIVREYFEQNGFFVRQVRKWHFPKPDGGEVFGSVMVVKKMLFPRVPQAELRATIVAVYNLFGISAGTV